MEGWENVRLPMDAEGETEPGLQQRSPQAAGAEWGWK